MSGYFEDESGNKSIVRVIFVILIVAALVLLGVSLVNSLVKDKPLENGYLTLELISLAFGGKLIQNNIENKHIRNFCNIWTTRNSQFF